MSEARKGPEVEMKLDGANQRHEKPREVYAHPNASRPDKPTIIEGEIKPIDQKPTAKKITVVLQGGPFDGTEVELPGLATKYDASFERDPGTIEPFVFDAEQHRRYVDSNGKEGRPNIVQGTLDTVTYKRTSQRTKEGLLIFEAA